MLQNKATQIVGVVGAAHRGNGIATAIEQDQRTVTETMGFSKGNAVRVARVYQQEHHLVLELRIQCLHLFDGTLATHDVNLTQHHQSRFTLADLTQVTGKSGLRQ